MFRGDARGHGDASGFWAPEEGRGAMGGGWAAWSDGSSNWGERGGPGDARSAVKAGGNAEDLGGQELEASDEGDFEFRIASF